MVSTTDVNTIVGPSIGSVTLVNRIHPPAPSTNALSYSSRGMPCSAAVMTMNVNPRLAQMLLSATAGSAVPGSCSRPGCFSDGMRPWNRSGSTPTWGCSSTNHTRLATATLVATVEENTVRKKPTPRICLSASTASPMPNAKPIGTVISASRAVLANACWNSLLRNTSTY